MRETSLDEFLDDGDDAEAADAAAESEPEAGGEDAVGEGADPGASEDGAEDVGDDEHGADPGGDDADGSVDEEARVDPETVEPAVSTYDWTPTGADCEACGEAVERRWRDDGRLVCGDCKAW